MRFLAALALLLLGLANAHHSDTHVLHYPRFPVGYVSLYDVRISMTSGVPGMSPQVAKAVIDMELRVYGETDNQLITQMHKVQVSNSIASVGSTTDEVSLKRNKVLEELLKVPSKVTFENGMITSYTLSSRETLESAKIKRTVLRNLEVYLDRQYLHGGSKHSWPLTYTLNRTSPAGNYSSHYVVTSSPFADFPADLNVFNISRTDNFEVIPYLAYRTHHNYDKQGCPEVCKDSHVENRYGAGCPTQHEPYHTPMKRSFVQHHNLKNVTNGGKSYLIIDSVETKETHVADVYDQNMEVTVRTYMTFTDTESEKIEESAGDRNFSDLNDLVKEVNEEEIMKLCKYPDTKAAGEKVVRLLNEITDIVLKDDIKEEKSKEIGEKLVTIQKAMQTLKYGDLRIIQPKIPIIDYEDLGQAGEDVRIKRQIWLDLLPVIGTNESVAYIVYLIKENANLPNKAISLWESKSILEALPENIHRPNGKTIYQLMSLLEVCKDPKSRGYHFFYSAAHMTVARVIRNLCAQSTRIPEENSLNEKSNSFRFLPRNFRAEKPEENEYRNNMARTCPKDAVKRFIEQIKQKLETTGEKAKRVIYIEALARTGLEEVLPILRKYVYGQQKESVKAVTGSGKTPYRNLTHSYVDYLQTVTIYALHNNVEKSPRAVQEMLVPVFFNTTESPKIRIAAFSVIIKSQPTLGLLQHIAEQSWREPSEEVGSYVTSTLETYGNSSHPCNQLIASRIKKMLPQLRRVDHGKQKAKNILWDLWDEFRGFGFEKHFDFTPSNESFIPSVLYGSLGYNANSLRDFFFQYALNVQGLTSRNVYDALLKRFGLTPADDIPKDSEDDIFPFLYTKMAPREPEFWRITAYQKFLYSTSYYYFDQEGVSFGEMFNQIRDHFIPYVSRDSKGNIKGHLIKVFIPSSFHAKTISEALPYPVQFEMKNPLLISMKFEVEKKRGDRIDFDLHLKPSVYYSTIYTNEILNLGDCKKVGVYHEKKIAASYPVDVSLSFQREGNYSFGLRFPKLPKDIFSYRSEAGTYAGKHYWTPLPPNEDKKTIKTRPKQFAESFSWRVPGLPRFSGKILSENINNVIKDIPRNAQEAALYAVEHFLNAGWRRKSVDISIGTDDTFWVPETEVKIHVNHSRNYFLDVKSSEADWSKDVKFDEMVEVNDTCEYAAEGKKIYQILSETMNHIKDILRVTVERRVKSQVENKADLNLEYFHTLGRFLHFVHFNASGNFPNITKEITADYAVAFDRRPNEFKYSTEFGKQRGLALGGVSFSLSEPFENSSVLAKALFNYTKLWEVLEMNPPGESEEFEPETHKECLSDVQNGEPLSVACIKAMREKSIYNHLNVHTVWMKEIPENVKEIGEKIDRALKYIYFSGMNVTRKSLSERQVDTSSIRLEATYFDKMTDEPVVDIVLNKPSEIVRFSKVSVGRIRPLSGIETLAETYAADMTNNSYPATCSLMNEHVRTYDMKTFNLPRDYKACTYVLSTHCTQHKKFAVLVDYIPRATGTKKVQVHVGYDKIVLFPETKSTYKVEFNGQVRTVKPLEPVMLNNTARLTAVVNTVHDGRSFIEIHARKAGLKVRYNGVNVNVQVHPRYKGELCGLCSEFNGEIIREFRGVDGCLYSDKYDFAKSCTIGKCRSEFRKPVYPAICNQDRFAFSWEEQHKDNQQEKEDWKAEGYEPTTKRNIVLNRVNKLCFSTKPVPVCDDNSEPSKTESQEIDFHCLPKLDANARKMVTESKRRILGELETKQVDHTETMEVAQKC